MIMVRYSQCDAMAKISAAVEAKNRTQYKNLEDDFAIYKNLRKNSASIFMDKIFTYLSFVLILLFYIPSPHSGLACQLLAQDHSVNSVK